MRPARRDLRREPEDSTILKNDNNKTGGRSYTGRLNQRKALLAKRWDKIAARACHRDWENIGIRTLASQTGLEWYSVRGDEPLASFLVLDGRALLARRGFGSRKIGRLCEIVERALDSELAEDLSDYTSTVARLDPHETLVGWGIPPAYPCRLSQLPVRLVNFCDNRGLAGIGELLEEWETLGFEGFKAQPNLGSKSVRQMERFVESLQKKDLETASLFLPIDSSGHGLSLASALKLIAAEPTASERSLLERRMVQRMTLEASAEESGLTRERVRQVEAKFLREVSEMLEYFNEDCARLLDAWIDIVDWARTLHELGLENDEIFITAALEAVFKATPQGIARTLGVESRLENWQEELLSHPELWFGGVKLSEFLTDHVPDDEQQGFCEHVSECPALRLDHMEGRVHPARTGLRNTVEALLAGEEDPIPLTWLIEMLGRTGYHPAVTDRDLLRRRLGWVKDYGFPARMILWDE